MDQASDGVATQFLTVSEVAGALRVSNMTVYRLVSAGELPAVKVGRSVRLRRDEVDEYLSGRLIKAG
jgi:excisionase family DNA binding protein